MNMKDIPNEVFEWLFEQNKKDEYFVICVTPDGVAFSNGLDGFHLLQAYSDGSLLSYLGDHGYTEKSAIERNRQIDEWIDEHEDDFESASDPIDFLTRTGLLEELAKRVHIFSRTPKDD